MKEVPFLISKKDVNMIDELLNINDIINKKIEIYLKCIKNNNVKNDIVSIKKIHKRHYKKIIKILK